MNIDEKLKTIKPFNKLNAGHINDIVIILIILLVGVISFGLGRISMFLANKVPVSVNLANVSTGDDAVTTKQGFVVEEKLYVVSRNGTKYHYPWCSGAQRIKEENKIWFATKEEAEKAGYTPAANCKGL
ncbi:hypothetical protein ACFLY5_00700 [Patescibacteria group bacterium]